MKLTLLLLLPCTALAVAPPDVKYTAPADGAVDVDPHRKSITIIFDQEMNRKTGYSVIGGGDAFPQLDGDPGWKNATTFTIPVKLRPGHTYTLQINGPSPKHKKFRAKDSDYPVAPYPIRFSTAAEGGQPADPRVTTKNSTAFTKLRTAFLGAYSHRGRTGIDWPPHIDRAEKALLAARTPQAFATSAAALLKKAKDPHIWLTLDATGTVIGSFSPDTSPNIEPSTLKKYVPNIQKLAPTVLVGELPNRGPIYIALTSFSEAASDDIDKAIGHIRALDPTSPVILDIRLNSGGSEILARKIAALFTPAPAVYATHQNITATGFTAVQERTVNPDPDAHLHTGSVAVLMGQKNVSSAESFLLMLRTVPRAILVGTQTIGASGNPKPHPLGNGVTLHLPSWQTFLPDGAELEGQGIPPDIEVHVKGIDLTRTDPVLEAARDALRPR